MFEKGLGLRFEMGFGFEAFEFRPTAGRLGLKGSEGLGFGLELGFGFEACEFRPTVGSMGLKGSVGFGLGLAKWGVHLSDFGATDLPRTKRPTKQPKINI